MNIRKIQLLVLSKHKVERLDRLYQRLVYLRQKIKEDEERTQRVARFSRAEASALQWIIQYVNDTQDLLEEILENHGEEKPDENS